MDTLEIPGDLKFLTTGQAATLYSVTRNAVFKWIQSGQLPAHRTAGGHHRIARRDLEKLLGVSAKPVLRKTHPIPEPRRHQYCWEYKGKGKAQAACLKCAVYALRALRCYEVSRIAPQANHAKFFCGRRCEDCDYFKEMHDRIANVLVVTNDRALTSILLAEADRASFNLEITDCEYNCSAILSHFKPDFVIVDCMLGREMSRQISHHLMKDSRIPYVRVIFAGSKEDFPRKCDKEVFARLARPFDIQNIETCINMVGSSLNAVNVQSNWFIHSQ